MGFSSLRLYHFRNLRDERYLFRAGEIFLIGENGQGKTNCLEALYLLCYGSSFRAKHERDMIKIGEQQSSVEGQYVSKEGVSHEISLILKKGEQREILVNGKRVTERKEILLSIPCVVFSHEDLEFIVGNPSKKRRFFNQTLCMYDLRYLDVLKNYKRVLHQRNACLKQQKTEVVSVYNQQLAHFGFEILKKRNEVTRTFNLIFQEYFRKISGLSGNMEILYQPSWQQCASPESCIHFLVHKAEQDNLYRTTTSGPHRDQFYYFYEGADFCRIASTGQLRLLSIILRVAQARFFTEFTGRKPVLLLDDVLLELDNKKRELFIKDLPAYEQAFFTFLPDEEYHFYEKETTEKYLVAGGRLKQWIEPEIF